MRAAALLPALHDITRMNSNARIFRAQLFNQADQSGHAKADEGCEICEKRLATSATTYYDMFGPDSKGLIFECEECRDRHGTREGYFPSEICARPMIEHYTWETCEFRLT